MLRIETLVAQLVAPKVDRNKQTNKITLQRRQLVNQASTTHSSMGAFLQIASPLVTQLLTSGEKNINCEVALDDASAIQELVKLVNQGELDFIEPESGGEVIEGKNWSEYRALMIALMYSQADARTISNLQDKIQRIAQHDEPPYPNNDKERALCFNRVMHIWRKSDDFYSGHGYLAIATRRDRAEAASMFERYLQGASNRHYDTYNPQQNGGTIEDFPGPGFVINGIRSKINRDLFEEVWTTPSEGDNPYQVVKKQYRQMIVKGEERLKNSTFFLFRGIEGVTNPMMTIDGEQYALIIFIDHFHNETGRMAYLIPTRIVEDRFLKNITSKDEKTRLNGENEFYPEFIEAVFYNHIICLNTISTIAGMNKAIRPGSTLYPACKLVNKQRKTVLQGLFEFERLFEGQETTDAGGKIHLTHMFSGYWEHINSKNYLPHQRADKEISHAAMFGFAQLDLLYDGFGLYSLGFDYNNSDSSWDFDSTRLLMQGIRWHNSNRLTLDEKPFLIPIRRFRYSQIDYDLIKKIGFLDTREMKLYRESSNFDGEQFPTSIQCDTFPENIRDPWREFINDAYRNGAYLIFVQGDTLSEILSDKTSPQEQAA